MPRAKSQTMRVQRREQFRNMADSEQKGWARASELAALLTEAAAILERQADGGIVSVSDMTAYTLVARIHKALE